MHKYLPPLKSLVAFSAASRCQNFSLAADELCITQSAISHQIKSLENFLGQKLFIRNGKSLALTEDGLQFSKVVNQSLENISLSAKYLIGDADKSIQLGVSSTFAIHQVAPKLSLLAERHPNLDVRLRMLSCSDDIPALNLDVVVYDRPLEHVAYDSELLKLEDYFAVATPDIAAKLQGISVDKWLNVAKFIDLQGIDTWSEWLQVRKVSDTPVNKLFFSHSILMVQAALNGQGIALLGETIIQQELVTGKLVKLDHNAMQFQRDGFYFHCHRRRTKDSNVRILKNWLTSLMN